MTDDCITIDSSDEEDIQIMEMPSSPKIKQESLTENRKKVPIKTIETSESVFTMFLNQCRKAEQSSEMDLVIIKMKKRFKEADRNFTSSDYFMGFVKGLMDRVSAEPYTQLKTVSDELKFHAVKSKKPSPEIRQPNNAPSTSSRSTEIDPKTNRHIQKLEELIRKLRKKIDFLENVEIDLNNSDDEEDSAYIQVSRYKDRICKVFKKICELKKTALPNDSLGNIKFSGTRISAVNRAIEKFYNDTREFPDFRDVLTIVEKANEIKSLNLLPSECQSIAIHAFKELGETLKRQRQYELNNCLSSYLKDTSDPALENSNLDKELEENKKLYGNRIDEIIDKFALKQEQDNVIPEDVPSDLPSESDGTDEEDEVTSVDEPGKLIELSSADDDDDDDTDLEEDEESQFAMCSVRVILPKLQEMPEWRQYKTSVKTSSASNSVPFESCINVCKPVAGCSKDTTNDFCLSCSDRELNRNADKRRRCDSIEDHSVGLVSKKSKYNSIDLTDEAEKIETADDHSPVFVDASAPVLEDVNNEGPTTALDSKSMARDRSSSPQTDASAVVDDSIRKKNSCDRPKDQRASPQNGIRIVSVSSKNNTTSPSGETKAVDKKSKPKDDEKVPSVVIDLENMPDTNSIIETTVSRFVNSPKDFQKPFPAASSSNSPISFLPSRTSSPQSCPPWQGKMYRGSFSPPKSFTNHMRPNNTMQRFPNSFYRTHNSRLPFNANNARNMQRFTRPLFPSPQQHQQRQQHQHPFRFNRAGLSDRQNMPAGHRAAVAKRTMQTTQKFIKGNNIVTQTMTVVQQQSITQINNPGNSGGGRGGGNRGHSFPYQFGNTNPRVGMTDTRRITAPKRNDAVHFQRVTEKRTNEVITLD